MLFLLFLRLFKVRQCVVLDYPWIYLRSANAVLCRPWVYSRSAVLFRQMKRKPGSLLNIKGIEPLYWAWLQLLPKHYQRRFDKCCRYLMYAWLGHMIAGVPSIYSIPSDSTTPLVIAIFCSDDRKLKYIFLEQDEVLEDQSDLAAGTLPAAPTSIDVCIAHAVCTGEFQAGRPLVALL